MTSASSIYPSGAAAQLKTWGDFAVNGPDQPPRSIFLICEHASCRFEEPWEQQLADSELHSSHAASDPGALGLSLELGSRLNTLGWYVELIHAPLSRLVYDLNRSPDSPDACRAQSELYSIPFNQQLSSAEVVRRVEQVYVPFHNFVQRRLARNLAMGAPPVIITVHSFSPVWYGEPRSLEFGVIHDALPELATRIVENSTPLGLVTALNEPYSAADSVTHTLKLHAIPYGLENAMLEVRNDLLATAEGQKRIASGLADIIVKSVTNAI